MSDEKPQPAPETPPERNDAADRAVDADIARRTRRGFITGGVAALAGFGVWEFIRHAHREGGVPWPLRQSLEVNEGLSRGYFEPARMAREFPLSSAENVKVNGDIGLDDDDWDASKWSLQVGFAGDTGDDLTTLTMSDIRALPRVEMV